MDRELMVEFIVDDLQDWFKRDKPGFWNYIANLERDYLHGLDDGDLLKAYQDTIPFYHES